MPTPVLRVAKSAEGSFFVRANECLICQLCVDAAPDLMACDDEQGDMSCYFTKQPTTPQEVESALRAFDHCCIGAIGYDGDDSVILGRIAELQAEEARRQWERIQSTKRGM